MQRQVEINDDFITLGQFLKKAQIIDTGGQAKFFIETNNIKINNKKPIGRGSKIFAGDSVWIEGYLYKVIKKEKEEIN
ncbi:RNA-binding S4 domain-containing protein [Mycoplasmopsis columbina]|uniref:Uncharacterized protein n=1 Tax=Mycoplasmopsis columbina SF7 TaxID=1037410 RepID=F9UJC3_9BACT|nr:RNA-binding S4 domain-containing protein [Mycoplasmopsis columbina]EGV00466.1 hypothetical protein MCSF7_02908 [Mycoplasmopsis columbina SF7]VEU76605.1 s4-like RNA-binding protein [Mycoplasmopsis columbina]